MNQKTRKIYTIRYIVFCLVTGLVLLKYLFISPLELFGQSHKKTGTSKTTLNYQLRSKNVLPIITLLPNTFSSVFSVSREKSVLMISKTDYGKEKYKTFYSIDKTPKKSTEINFLKLNFISVNSTLTGGKFYELNNIANYLIGSVPEQWRRKKPSYSKIAYQSIYPGIDIIYRGTEGTIHYDFRVAANADAGQIQFKFEGADKIEIDAVGDLVLHLGERQIIQRKPTAYQTVNGVYYPVAVRYLLGANHQVAFEVGNYDRTKPLVIQPVMVYSTYFGGSAPEQSAGIALDRFGNQYLVGSTLSTDFPGAQNPLSEDGLTNRDVYVAKFKAVSGELEYITYLGGESDDEAAGIAVDKDGYVYVTGTTKSDDFPTTPGSFQSKAPNGSNAFVAKLSKDGSKLIYSTYVGGNADDESYGISIDAKGSAYLTGVTDSLDFPQLKAYQNNKNGASDAFVAKLNPTGADLAYSTYFGGAGEDWGLSLAVDNTENVYLTGTTSSTNLPATAGAPQPVYAGGASDAFVAKFNTLAANGTDSLRFCTFVGGAQSDGALSVALDSQNAVYLTGFTRSKDFSENFRGAATDLKGASDAFAVKLNPSGTAFEYKNLYGGSGQDYGFSIAVNENGEAFLAGSTESKDFPVTADSLQSEFGGGSDAFVIKIDAAGGRRIFSSFFGGRGEDDAFSLALDASGNFYLTGISTGNLKTTSTAVQKTLNGATDAFFIKVLLSDKSNEVAPK